MNYINGKNVILIADGKKIAAAKDITIELNTDVQEIASNSSAIAKEYIAKRTSWTSNVSGIVLSRDVKDAAIESHMGIKHYIMKHFSHNVIDVQFEDGTQEDGSPSIITGKAIITQTSIGAKIKSLTTYRIRLQGSGELE